MVAACARAISEAPLHALRSDAASALANILEGGKCGNRVLLSLFLELRGVYVSRCSGHDLERRFASVLKHPACLRALVALGGQTDDRQAQQRAVMCLSNLARGHDSVGAHAQLRTAGAQHTFAAVLKEEKERSDARDGPTSYCVEKAVMGMVFLLVGVLSCAVVGCSPSPPLAGVAR